MEKADQQLASTSGLRRSSPDLDGSKPVLKLGGDADVSQDLRTTDALRWPVMNNHYCPTDLEVLGWDRR